MLDRETRRLSTGGFVREPSIAGPLAAYAVDGVRSPDHRRIEVLTVSASLSTLLWARASDAQRSALRKWLRIYVQHERIAERMDESISPASPNWPHFYMTGLGHALEFNDVAARPVMEGHIGNQSLLNLAAIEEIPARYRKDLNQMGYERKRIEIRPLDWSSAGIAASEQIVKAWPPRKRRQTADKDD